MQQFDWLLFDLDNTILDFGKSSKYAFKMLLQSIDPDLDSDVLYPIYNEINHEVWDKREAGLICHSELKWKRWDLFFKAKNIDSNPHIANDVYFDGIKEYPFYVDHALDMLEDIKPHFNLMMVTNGLSEVQWPRIKAKNLEPHFEHIIISDEIGVAKPQPAFFDHCHDLLGKPEKDRVLVIGDTLKSDILGGNNFGYKTCWYNYYGKENTTGIKPDFKIDTIKDLKNDVLQINY